jgi:hypothetical protein
LKTSKIIFKKLESECYASGRQLPGGRGGLTPKSVCNTEGFVQCWGVTHKRTEIYLQEQSAKNIRQVFQPIILSLPTGRFLDAGQIGLFQELPVLGPVPRGGKNLTGPHTPSIIQTMRMPWESTFQDVIIS